MLKVVHAKRLEEACKRKIRETVENSEVSFSTNSSKNIEGDTAELVVRLCLKAQEEGTLFYCYISNIDDAHICYFISKDEESLIQKASDWSEDDPSDHADPWSLIS